MGDREVWPEKAKQSDADLLAAFEARRGEAEFDALVARHGAMVFRTCLRVLGDFHAAEDAAQAVFLALAERPGAARRSLPGWLHEVARRTSLNILRSRRRRDRHEQEASRMIHPTNDDPAFRSEFDRVLSGLPAALREAVVLRYLEGRSQGDAARMAGCPQGTLAWRAAEGLSRLRAALSRQGIVLGGAALVAVLAGEAQASVPPAVLAGLHLAALPSASATAVVAKGVVKTLLWKKTVGLVAASAFGLAVVAGLAAAMAPAQDPAPRPPATQAAAPVGAAYNVSLLTDKAPDFTDVGRYLRSITSQHETPQEKAIAVWRWSQRLRKQAGHPWEDGHEVIDPIQFFTSYGYTMCGLISGTDNALWLNLGWKAHYVQLGDHTVCECSWDGGKTWHMFDNSMSFFCYNDKGEVASVREIEQNPRYYLRNFAPECGTNPVRDAEDLQGWRSGTERPVEYQRTLAGGCKSYALPNDVIEDHLAATWGRTYAINLRPGEHYTRHFRPLDAARPDPRYYRPNGGRDPEGTFFKNIRGTGVWRYAPDLRDPATRAFVYRDSAAAWTPDGVKGPGSVTFKVSAANVVTSARLALRASGAAVSVSRDTGIRWTPVDTASGTAELLEPVAGASEVLVKVDLSGPASLLKGIEIETRTQLNRPSLPKLARGANRVQLSLGPQVETITLVPWVAGGRHRETAFEEASVEVNPKPYFNQATVRAIPGGGPSHVTWKIQAPTPIVDVVYGGNVTVKDGGGSASFLHSWDGKTFVQDYRKADGALPWDLMALAAVDRAPADARDVYLRYQFEAPAATNGWRAPGLQSALMTVHHRPRATAFAPVEVAYCWVEHRKEGDLERRHVELVTSPAHEYTIHVAGFRDPTMKWVRLNLKGQGPDGDKVLLGYSDGKDVGPADGRPAERYRWGRNLAEGRPYVLEGRASEKNPDRGNDLTDGVIAPPDEYVSSKWMPTNVIFQKDVSPVVTIDLGSAQSVAAVRIHTGQSPDFHLAHPESITVETSADGKIFSRAGTVGHDQVFDPPADFVPWELDDAAQFDTLPAGGRLVYAYRVLFERAGPARYVRVSCASRKDWGLMLSEIQVFDSVQVDRNLPPAVVLPPLSKIR